MSEVAVFLVLGFRHITDFAAMDHILFLCALAAIYRLQDWRRSLWVITAFTVGHSVTLALAVTGALALPTRLIEFLIPVTIVATCVENLVVRDRARAPWRRRSLGGGAEPVVTRPLDALCAIGVLALHPLHMTPTELSFNAVDRTVQVSVRAFADDFHAAARDGSDSAAFVYLRSALTLSDRDRRVMPLAWCGVRRDGDLLWLCLRAPAPRGLAGVQVCARLLFERYRD